MLARGRSATEQAFGHGIANKVSERLGESVLGCAHSDVARLSALALEQPAGVVQAHAMLKQQTHLGAPRVDRADVAGIGSAESQCRPSRCRHAR